jgi:pyridoxamine 5'-phosphate oxidase family protein
MSAFTEQEISYLRANKLGRLATADAEGQPLAIPVTYFFNEDEDTIDVIGPPRRARAVEIRGDAELHETGGETINPRFPNFASQFIRIRPTRIVSWGMEEDATTASATASGVDHKARDVG